MADFLPIRPAPMRQIINYFEKEENHLDCDKKHVSKKELRSAVGKISEEADDYLSRLLGAYSEVSHAQIEGKYNDRKCLFWDAVSMRDLYAVERGTGYNGEELPDTDGVIANLIEENNRPNMDGKIMGPKELADLKLLMNRVGLCDSKIEEFLSDGKLDKSELQTILSGAMRRKEDISRGKLLTDEMFMAGIDMPESTTLRHVSYYIFIKDKVVNDLEKERALESIENLGEEALLTLSFSHGSKLQFARDKAAETLLTRICNGDFLKYLAEKTPKGSCCTDDLIINEHLSEVLMPKRLSESLLLKLIDESELSRSTLRQFETTCIPKSVRDAAREELRKTKEGKKPPHIIKPPKPPKPPGIDPEF